MPFMVIYRTSDGSSSSEQLEAIDEAALFVERLRNNEGVDQIRIYRMEEISFAFRPYYKVELGMPERQQHPSPPDEVVGVGTPPVEPPAEAAPAVDEVVVEVPGPLDAPAIEVIAEADEDATAGAPASETEGPTSPLSELGANGARRGLFGR